MAVVFPRVIPPVGYTFDDPLMLQRFTSQAQSGGRLTGAIEYADPVWMVTLTTVPMYEDEMRVVEAWWDSLREGLRSVLFRSPNYAAPRGNRLAPTPAQTIGTLASITNGNVLSVSGVSAGLILGAGDYVSFLSGANRGLARIIDATGTGSTRTIEVEPYLPTTIPVGAIVYFDRAAIITRPVRGSFERSKVQDVAFSATFQLVESRT